MKALKLLFGFFALLALLAIGGFFFSLGFQERLLWIGITPLFPGFVQRAALVQLRHHPTRATAIALVVFTNLKYSHPRSQADLEAMARERCKDETTDNGRQACQVREFEILSREEKDRNAAREKNNKIAESAVETLCLLSGESFGSHFEKNQWGHGWGSLSDERWRLVLPELNHWAFRHFGAETLAAAGMSSLAQELSQHLQNLPVTVTIQVDTGSGFVSLSDSSTGNLADTSTILSDATTRAHE